MSRENETASHGGNRLAYITILITHAWNKVPLERQKEIQENLVNAAVTKFMRNYIDSKFTTQLKANVGPLYAQGSLVKSILQVTHAFVFF